MEKMRGVLWMFVKKRQNGFQPFFNSNSSSSSNLFDGPRRLLGHRNYICCGYGYELILEGSPKNALISAWDRIWSPIGNLMQNKGIQYAGMTTYACHIKRPKKIKEGPMKKKVQQQNHMIQAFETIVDRDEDFRFLMKTKEWLMRVPEQVLQLDDAGKMHRQLGFRRGKKVTRYIEKHPALFQLYRHTDGKMWFGFTDLMEKLLEEERKIRGETEKAQMDIVRKLVMMSADKRISVAKFHHCRHIFGLTDDFRDRIKEYPQFFRVVEEGDCRFLELTQWDPSLAVTALEARYIGNEDKVKNAFVFPVKYAKQLNLGKEGTKRLNTLNSLPLISPYSDTSNIEPASLHGQKYRVCLIHEFLSLTLEKNASAHHLSEFKDEFRLTKDTFNLIQQQQRTFYVAGTEMNWTVFLKDAYRGEELIEKDPLVDFKEKLFSCGSLKQSDPKYKEILHSNRIDEDEKDNDNDKQKIM